MTARRWSRYAQPTGRPSLSCSGCSSHEQEDAQRGRLVAVSGAAGQPNPTRRIPPPPVLDGGTGVRLRAHRVDDADAIFEMCQDPDMQRWTTIPVPYGPSDSRWFLDHVVQAWEESTTACLAIELHGRYAGNVELRLVPGSWAEVGYATAPWARRQGVMTRALTMMLHWGFGSLGLAGVQWRAEVGNRASRLVAEKCGFRVEGTVRGLLVHRGQRVDGWIGTLLAEEL